MGKPVNSEFWAYVPEDLTAKDRQLLGDDLELAYCVMGLIHYFRVRQKQGKDDWVQLGADYCTDLFGWRDWYRVRDLMISVGILEQSKEDIKTDDFGFGIEHVEQRGHQGGKCYGYRLRHDLRHSTHRKTPLTDARAIRTRHEGIKGYTLKWLRKKLKQLSIAPVPDSVLYDAAREEGGDVEAKVEAYREQIRWINEGAWTFNEDDFAGRVHTNLTGLKKELRPYLRVTDEDGTISQLDLKACQVLMIGIEASKAGFHDEHFLECCQQDIYQYIADKLSLSRKEVKKQLTQSGLFSSNKSKHQQSEVMRFLKKEFPTASEFIRQAKAGRKTKANPKPHNKLAKIAQKAEVEFMIHTVCERIRKERPEMFVATIHDSLLFLTQNAEYVKLIVSDEFKKQGYHPRLEVEHYGEQERHSEPRGSAETG